LSGSGADSVNGDPDLVDDLNFPEDVVYDVRGNLVCVAGPPLMPWGTGGRHSTPVLGHVRVNTQSYGQMIQEQGSEHRK
jgi:hypothetical protein